MLKYLMIGIVALLLVVLFMTGYKVWTLGGHSDDWNVVCVKGQTVYRANFAQKAMAVNALDAQGKPIACNHKGPHK